MARYIAYNVKSGQIHSSELSLSPRVTIDEIRALGFESAFGWRVVPKSRLFKDKSLGSDFHLMTQKLAKDWYRTVKDGNGIVIGIISQSNVYHYGKMSALLISQCSPADSPVFKLSEIDFINLFNSSEEPAYDPPI